MRGGLGGVRVTAKVEFEFPPGAAGGAEAGRPYARRSILLITLTGIVLYLTTGSSQTMKTAWVTDFLSIVPSMALFGALRRELQPPDERYPFGHLRADRNALVARIESARQDLTTLDWRLHSITVMPVAQVGEESKRGRSTSMM